MNITNIASNKAFVVFTKIKYLIIWQNKIFDYNKYI